ncbi:MAG: hypothetical protein MUO62_00685 [Anaerolineales bacterium]|nr:hypothetical protein [Anaerolineales bacterium]
MENRSRVNTAKMGCHIDLLLIHRSGEQNHLDFDLVPDDQADFENNFLGISTHLAKTIIGESPGYLIPYFTDELKAIKIISVRTSIRKSETGKNDHRKEILNQTRTQIEFRNAVLFASSTDTKWGSYDADALDFDKWKSEQGQEK